MRTWSAWPAPTLETIGAETHETVNLSVGRGDRVVQVAQVDSRFILGSRDWTQDDVPAHCSSLGKVFLAWDVVTLPDGPLDRPTPATIATAAALRADSARSRTRGWATTVDELEIGLSGIAVPVLGPRGQVVAALGVSGPDATTGRAVRRDRAAVERPRRGAHRAAPWQDTRGGRSMTTPDEVLKGLYDETLVGNAPRVLELTEEGLALGMEPQTLLFDALIPSLEEVGARFERGDFFVPEMLIAGRAMAGAMERLRPLLAETGVETVGKFLMGTVKGDVHDIGKNLVNIMLEGAGFEVIDLGVQVAPEKFVAAIEEHQPDIVGFSAFLTTTMPMFKANINALEKAGLRDQVVVMVGGAPVTQEYADAVGADGYAADASACVKRAKDLLQKRRAKVNA